MEFSDLVDAFRELEGTQATLEKTAILSALFRRTDPSELPAVIRLVRGTVTAPWESVELGVSGALALEAVSRATGVSEDRIEEWWRETGDLGNAAARAVDRRRQQTLAVETLDVRTVHDRLREIAGYEGEGSESRRVGAVAGLLSGADPEEARYLVRVIVGAMRLGVGEGTIRDAIADAFLDGSEEAVAAVEGAYEVTNDFEPVVVAAREAGIDGLAELDVELFRPVKPMLARKGEGVEDAVERIRGEGGEVLLEVKYDGMRAKLHVRGDDRRVFTRRLTDVTDQFPDVVEAVGDHLSLEEAILEAEVVGHDPDDGSPVPFQELSRRIKRKYDVGEMVETIPVVVYGFDLLYADGESLLDTPLRDRLARLDDATTVERGRYERAAHRRPLTVEDAEAFYERALAAGHEGLMVKNLDAPYQPGSRVGYMLKVKPTMEPLDLVVTRAKWSEGRKSDFLGRPYLACRDAESGDLLEVGRMHTGFTDAELETLTERIEPLITAVDGREATLRPELVIEVEYEEIQRSPTYDSGYALRFPRFGRFRDDLDPSDADTLSRVESLYDSQGG